METVLPIISAVWVLGPLLPVLSVAALVVAMLVTRRYLMGGRTASFRVSVFEAVFGFLAVPSIWVNMVLSFLPARLADHAAFELGFSARRDHSLEAWLWGTASWLVPIAFAVSLVLWARRASKAEQGSPQRRVGPAMAATGLCWGALLVSGVWSSYSLWDLVMNVLVWVEEVAALAVMVDGVAGVVDWRRDRKRRQERMAS